MILQGHLLVTVKQKHYRAISMGMSLLISGIIPRIPPGYDTACILQNITDTP